MSSNTQTLQAVLIYTIVCLSLSVQLSSCWTLKTSPTLPTRVNHAVWKSTTVTFQADVALVDCQCRTHRTENNEISPLMDFSQGVHAASYYHSSNSKWHYNASFGGPALELKGCGFKMSDLTYPFILVVCRARPSVGNWQYQQVALVLEDYALFPMTVQPPYQVILPGSSAVVICKAYRTLEYCGMLVPRLSKWLPFHSGHNSSAEDGVKYSGTSLREGHCGAEVTNTTNADSGPVWCYVDSYAGSMVSVMTSLVLVATPPSKAILTFPSGKNFIAGNKLTATCTVSPSNPVANITWLLGSKVIRQDHTNDVIVPDLAWVWPWAIQSLTQTLVYEVSSQDFDKELTCRVNHLALDGPLEQKQKISVLGECGQKGPSSQALIAGGSIAMVGEYPWHIGVYEQNNNSSPFTYKHLCGGTLVTPRMVITAANCVWDIKYGRPFHYTKFKVSLGRIGLNWNVTETGEIKMGIEEIKMFDKEYNFQTLNNDIAIIILERPVPLSRTIGLACVEWDWDSREDEQLLGQKGIVAGWGWTESGTQKSDSLQSLQLLWVPKDICLDAIHENNKFHYTEDKFCAGLVNKKTSVCPGDSGGGLLFAHPTTKLYYLRGVTSTSFPPMSHHLFEDGCYSQGYSGFTRLSFHMAWIKDNRVT